MELFLLRKIFQYVSFIEGNPLELDLPVKTSKGFMFTGKGVHKWFPGGPHTMRSSEYSCEIHVSDDKLIAKGKGKITPAQKNRIKDITEAAQKKYEESLKIFRQNSSFPEEYGRCIKTPLAILKIFKGLESYLVREGDVVIDKNDQKYTIEAIYMYDDCDANFLALRSEQISTEFGEKNAIRLSKAFIYDRHFLEVKAVAIKTDDYEFPKLSENIEKLFVQRIIDAEKYNFMKISDNVKNDPGFKEFVRKHRGSIASKKFGF